MLNKSIIDELYYARCDEFEIDTINKEGVNIENSYIATDEINEILNIIPQEQHQEVKKYLDFIIENFLIYNSDWNKKYYRLGMQDAMNLLKELNGEELT